jgi:hypothetical protein
MVMAVSFCVLGVFYMSITLVDVVKELRRCTAELKESNDKWQAKEQAALEQYNLENGYESTTILRSSDDGTTPTRSTEHFKISNRRETDEL